MRHSTAHLLAAAVMELFPTVKLGVGPVVENGFYYDLLAPEPITEAQLSKIEKRMREIKNRGEAFRREELPIDGAIVFFKERQQDFKVELLNDLKTKGTTKIKGEEASEVDPTKPAIASVYHTGKFVDLCRGPHVATTAEIGAFKLNKIAGAYWRGNEKNPQLTRIYGLAFRTEAELAEHLKMLEEAKLRDHRKLGKDLELFTIIDEVGPGLPLFYPKGALLRRLVENYIGELQERRGYLPIWIPHITKGKLYEISGHLQKFDALYPPMRLEGEESYYLKPMNCPHFMMLYRSEPHSYRDLPLRYVCTTTNYRHEKSGELSGLTRVRSLTQDDCHVFAAPAQIEGEINLMLDMIAEVYETFQFKNFWVRISTADPEHPEKYIGDRKVWREAEAALSRLIAGRGWKHELGVGEAAFYGPKLDFMAKDVIGREWQLSTIQLDMNLPERFELEYVDADGAKKRPVVIHRAILGSTERFLGILIEHYAGAFPTWLAPVQVALVPVGEAHFDFARKLGEKITAAGIRVQLDSSSETVGYKIRKAEKQKVPYMLVVGDKEMKSKSLMVRLRGEKEVKKMALTSFLKRLKTEIETKK